MSYGKGRCGPSKTRGGSSCYSDPPPESEQGEVVSSLTPISDGSGFSKASTSSSAEIRLERPVKALVKSDEECTTDDKTREEQQKRLQAY